MVDINCLNSTCYKTFRDGHAIFAALWDIIHKRSCDIAVFASLKNLCDFFCMKERNRVEDPDIIFFGCFADYMGKVLDFFSDDIILWPELKKRSSNFCF